VVIPLRQLTVLCWLLLLLLLLLPVCVCPQVEGAFLQGLGHVLTEEVLEDPGSGRVLSSSTWSYKPPGIAELPGVRGGGAEAVQQHGARRSRAAWVHAWWKLVEKCKLTPLRCMYVTGGCQAHSTLESRHGL
jgi:hypothetical protein